MKFSSLPPEVCALICEFLPARDRAKAAKISKSVALASTEAFAYHKHIKNSKMPDDVSPYFLPLLHLFYLCVLKGSPRDMFRRTRKLVKKGYNIKLINTEEGREEYRLLNKGMYDYWDEGVYDTALELATENLHIDIMHKVKSLRGWKQDRIHGAFYALLQRPDGTVVISEDMEEVYIVLNLRDIVDDMISEGHRYPIKFYGTILPFEGYLAFDGVFGHMKDVPFSSKSFVRALYQVYANAVDTHSVIYTKQNTLVPMRVTPCSCCGFLIYEDSLLSEEQCRIQLLLRSAPKLSGDSGVWAFFTHDYDSFTSVTLNTEHENDITVNIGVVFPIVRPTVDNFLRKLEDLVINGTASTAAGFAPHTLIMDDDNVVHFLHGYVKDCGIISRCLTVEQEDPDYCSSCGQMETRHFKLRACSKCKEAKYCDTECQRADWKHHKKYCGKTHA